MKKLLLILSIPFILTSCGDDEPCKISDIFMENQIVYNMVGYKGTPKETECFVNHLDCDGGVWVRPSSHPDRRSIEVRIDHIVSEDEFRLIKSGKYTVEEIIGLRKDAPPAGSDEAKQIKKDLEEAHDQESDEYDPSVDYNEVHNDEF